MKISRLIPLALVPLLLHLSSASNSDEVSKEEQIEGEDDHRISKRFIHLISYGPNGERRTEGKRVWDKHLRNALRGGKVELVLDMEKPKKFIQRIIAFFKRRRHNKDEWWNKPLDGHFPNPDENGFVPPLDDEGHKFPPLNDDGHKFPTLNDEDVEDKARPHHKYPVLRRPPVFKLDSKEADDDMLKDEGKMALRPPVKNEDGGKIWRPPGKDDGNKVWRPPNDEDRNKVWRPPVEANEEDKVWRPPGNDDNKVWRPPVKDEAGRKLPSPVDEEAGVESEEKDNDVDGGRNSNREELDVDARIWDDDDKWKNLKDI